MEVVKSKLDKCELGEFCLEIHSHNKDKKDVIRELAYSLTKQSRTPLQESTHKRLDLLKIRTELNQYVRALHKPRFQLGYSLYRIQGELAKLHEAPVSTFSLPNLNELSVEQQYKRLSIIRDLETYDKLIKDYQNHPWKGINLKSAALQQREELANRFFAGAEDIYEFTNKIGAVAERFHIKKPETLREGINLLRVVSVFQSTIFTEEYSPIIERYLKDYSSKFRYFSLKFWKNSSSISKIHRQHKRLDPIKAEQYLKLAIGIRNKSEDFKPLTGQNLTEQELKNSIKIKDQIMGFITFSKDLYDKNDTPETLINIFDTPTLILSDWFRKKANQVEEIVEWVTFHNKRAEAEEIGLGDFIVQALNTGLFPMFWERAFLRRFYLLMTDEIIQSDKALAHFRSSTHTNLIKRFKQLDKEIINSSRAEIKSRLQLAQPSYLWIQAQSAETTILKKRGK